MKIVKKLFLLVLVAFFFSGCIEVQTTVNVNKDGSGTIQEKVLFSKEMVQMLSSFNVSDSSSAKDTSKSPFYDVDKLKSEAKGMGEGVEFISSKEIKEGDREGYMATYGFKDLNKIKVSENPENKASIGNSNKDQGKKNKYLTFKYISGSPAEILISMPKEKMKNSKPKTETKKDTSNMNNPFAKQFLSMMKDFRFSLSVNVNGKIESTNATYVNGSKITLFDVEFDKLLENKDKVDELNNIQNYNTEEMKKILKGMPGVKIELKNPVILKFE